MIKTLGFIIFVLVLVGAIVYFTKSPSFIYNRVFGRVLGESISSTDQSSSSPISPNSLINQTQNSLEDTSHQITAPIKDSLYNSAQSGLDTIFNKSQPNSSTPVSVSILDPGQVSVPQQAITLIDLSKDNNLKMSLPRSSKYDFKFQNTQANQCLYINGNKYPIDNSKIIEVEFDLKGNYPIKVNSCDLNDKVIGEFDIQ